MFRVSRLADSEDSVIIAGVVLTQYSRVTNGQTDGRTDAVDVALTRQKLLTPCKNVLNESLPIQARPSFYSVHFINRLVGTTRLVDRLILDV